MRILSGVWLGLVLGACGGGSSPDGGVDSGQPQLSGLPDCGTPADAGSAADLYTSVVVPYGCGSGGCHGGAPPVLFEILDPASFRSAMLAKSAQVPALSRVAPRDIHRSYLLYKLMGQHQDAGYAGTGERMPRGGPYLSDGELCSVVSWIAAGAP